MITAAIDDHPHHIQAYRALDRQVFVMDQPWNRAIPHADVIRVSGWDALVQWLHVRHLSSWPKYIPESPTCRQLFSVHLKLPSLTPTGVSTVFTQP
jgi:hypothetical protein